MNANKVHSQAHKACDRMQTKIFWTMMPLIQAVLSESYVTNGVKNIQTFHNPEQQTCFPSLPMLQALQCEPPTAIAIFMSPLQGLKYTLFDELTCLRYQLN